MAARTPKSLTLKTYDVGFGDCFLLKFDYGNYQRHVLIDFGTMRLPKGKTINGKVVKTKDYMNHIASQIAGDCGGKLDIVVATHRHQDHISGFERKEGKGPGEIIRQLKPKLVIQPWTEDPRAKKNAIEPVKLHLRSLTQMQNVAQSMVNQAASFRDERFKALRSELSAIGMDNISNRDAIVNLQTMSRKHRYVYHGKSAATGRILPGVKVTVLGPPTVKQTNTILKQRSSDPDQFWHMRAQFWDRLDLTGKHLSAKKPLLFPKHPTGNLPKSAGWYKYWAMREHAESLLSIVRTLDKAMNNTSVILLFEIKGKMLLFPGDAQYENWMYTLDKPEILKRLAQVDVYKVGHHGSLNATPKKLWNSFKRKGTSRKRRRLKSLLSTKKGVHGKISNKSEVPRRTLMSALDKNSDLTTTEDYKSDEFCKDVLIKFK